MSDINIELPESIKDCLPCQENAITSTLLTLCNISEELNSDIDCKQLSQDIVNGVKTKQQVISEIAQKSKGTSVEHTVDKIINVLNKPDISMEGTENG